MKTLEPITQRSAQAVLKHVYNVLVKTDRLTLAQEVLALIEEDENRKLFHARPLSDVQVKPNRSVPHYEPGVTRCFKCGFPSHALSGKPEKGMISATCLRCGATGQYRSHSVEV